MAKRTVVLINLGSPDEPEPGAVRRYLREFLMDGRVIDLPWPLRFLIVFCFILPFRPKRSAALYKEIWTEEGSPLVVLTERLAAKLQSRLPHDKVMVAMRYGNPNMRTVLPQALAAENDEILLVPLYPHNAMSSFETVLVYARAILKPLLKKYPGKKVTYLKPFFDHPAYVGELAASIDEVLTESDHLLFSYHSIPVGHLPKTAPFDEGPAAESPAAHCKADDSCCVDPPPACYNACYRFQSLATTKLVAEKLGLKAGSYSSSFQSKLGRAEWLTPATDTILNKAEHKNLAVVTPSFVADCLETLEEIGITGEKDFMAAGGRSFKRIECLNERDGWVRAFTEILDDQNSIRALM